MPQNKVDVKILPLENFLQPSSGKFILPFYQRPFSWEEKQVNALLETIKDNDCHFLGNFVIHEEHNNSVNGTNNNSNITRHYVVDGQQRLTCILLLCATQETNYQEGNGKKWLEKLQYEYGHEQEKSIENLKKAQQLINDSIYDLPKSKVWTKMYVQQTTVKNDLELAFTFFDAQNTAGLPALSKDMLKARHLQKMIENGQAGNDDNRAIEMDNQWTEMENFTHEDGKSLTQCIFNCLLPVRRWTRGLNSPYYLGVRTDYTNREKVEEEFAGKRMLRKIPGKTPFAIPIRVFKLFYQNQDFRSFTPFKQPNWKGYLTMPLEPGELFFCYIKHYHERWREIRQKHRFSLWLESIKSDETRVINHISVQRLDWIAIAIAVYLDDMFGEESVEFQHLMQVVYSCLALHRVNNTRVEKTDLEKLNGRVTLSYLHEMLRNLSLGIDPFEFKTAAKPDKPTEKNSNNNGFDIKEKVWNLWAQKK